MTVPVAGETMAELPAVLDELRAAFAGERVTFHGDSFEIDGFRLARVPPHPPRILYLLGRSPVQFECLWIGRCHRAAIGTDLVERVLAGGSVTLIDTSSGRPDVGACVARVAHRFDAVFVVSNDVVRDSVARACEALGVPWYGPTFDS